MNESNNYFIYIYVHAHRIYGERSLFIVHRLLLIGMFVCASICSVGVFIWFFNLLRIFLIASD